jgi:histidinol-phosphate aminotransferase
VLANNESPLGPSPAVVEAVQRHAAALGSYPPETDDALRIALADFYGRGLTPDHFVAENGAATVLDLVARVTLAPGDAAVICPPTFPIYAMIVEYLGGAVIPAPLDEPSFDYNIDRMLAAVTPRTRLLFVCSPNNPTGNIMTADQLSRLLAGLPPEVLVVYDEVYHHFVTQTGCPDAIGHVLAGDNLIIIHSFAKAYGMAGLRLGYGIARPELIRRLAALRRPFYLGTLLFEAGLAALGDPAHVQRTVETTLAGREWLYGQLQELGLQVWPGQGNFLLFACPVPASEWAAALEQRGILVRPAYGLSNHMRVSVGLPAANQALVEALGDIIAHG